MEQNSINPLEYGYDGTEKIVITSEVFQRFRTVLDYFLSEETQELYPQNYKYIDKLSGGEIKTVTDKNKDNAVKIVDIQKTLSSKEPLVYRTKEGLEILRLKLMFEKVHMEMIENGTAKHRTHFENLSNPSIENPLGESTEGTEE